MLLAPVSALILVLASAGLRCDVMSLSLVGTVIQFAVFWCTRVVYAMVRITLSQTWAGLPGRFNAQLRRMIEPLHVAMPAYALYASLRNEFFVKSESVYANLLNTSATTSSRSYVPS